MPTFRTANSGLYYWEYLDRRWDIPFTAMVAELEGQAPLSGLNVIPATVDASFAPTGLNVHIGAGSYDKADLTYGSYAGISSYAVPASATTYLWLTDAGVLTAGSGWPAATNIVRLAIVVAGATDIVSISDQRAAFSSRGATGGAYLLLAGGTLADPADIVVGTTTGTKIGTGATQKLGFWGATPGVRPAGANQVAMAALTSGTVTNATGGTVTTTLAAATNVATLTDSTGGSASTTLASIADTPTANALASLAAQHALQRALNIVVINALASLAAQHNLLVADVAAARTLLNQIRSDAVAIGLLKGSA